MGINWRVRIKNRTWWIAMVPAVLLAIQEFCAIFGYQLDLTLFGENLIAFINAVFAVLVIMGVVIDPTTNGISDSDYAMTFQVPRKSVNTSDEEKIGGTE